MFYSISWKRVAKKKKYVRANNSFTCYNNNLINGFRTYLFWVLIVITKKKIFYLI